MGLKQVCDRIEEILTETLNEDDFNLNVDPEGGEAAIEADDWTIQFSVVNGELNGFLAIDDEPDNAASYPAAWRAALGEPVELALTDADRELEGALSAALVASGDPFSAAFAAHIRQSAE